MRTVEPIELTVEDHPAGWVRVFGIELSQFDQ